MQVYSSVYWIGHVLFVVVWPALYALLPKSRRADVRSAAQHNSNTHR